jgi:hypothetical protein
MRITVQFEIDLDDLPALHALLSANHLTTPGELALKTAPAKPAAPATAVSAAPPAAPVFNEEDVASATKALASAKGIDAATGLLREFAIDKARDLPADKRDDFIARAKQLQIAP